MAAEPTRMGNLAQRNFPARVFAIVAQIPFGRVTTYGRIARAIGEPRAGRMVGWALHASHAHPDLPCHRVINRNGELTGRLHWGDPDLMRHLLESEGVEFDAQERVDLDRFGWYPDEATDKIGMEQETRSRGERRERFE